MLCIALFNVYLLLHYYFYLFHFVATALDLHTGFSLTSTYQGSNDVKNETIWFDNETRLVKKENKKW